MAFLRTIAVLTTLAATSVAAFAPLAPAGYRFSSLSKTGRILLPSATQYGRVQACTPKPLRIAPHRRVSMAWNSESYLIAPSIVNADLANLGQEVDYVIAAGADVVHMDVGDGHFGKDLSLGPMVCKALKGHGVKAPIDVHLKTLLVNRRIADFIKAGADCISFHPEASDDVAESIAQIKAGGIKAGLALNVETDLEVVRPLLDNLDVIILMYANKEETMEKARAARRMIDEAGANCRLCVDGGVSGDNMLRCAQAGADMFVVGSALFKAPRSQKDYGARIAALRKTLEAAPINRQPRVRA